MRETAAAHLVKQVPTARGGETAATVRARLAGRTWDVVDELYLVDEGGHLLGVVPATRLFAAGDDERVGALSHERAAVRGGADQEAVAVVALRSGVTSVPVVDDGGRLLGVVPPLAMIDILHREHVEDLHRLAGIGREDAFVRESLDSPPLRRARDRLPWLLVGLAGSVLATMIMAFFERTLAEKLAVSFFVPAIVYLADAVGTQTETIVVRGLSHSHRSLGQLLRAELGTGLIIGAALGGVALPMVWLAFGDLRLSLAVGTAIWVAGAVATTVGLVLPWFIKRVGRDPAFGSGPLATVVQDVLSLVVYFAVVQVIVR
jgi:magnesium transporter